MRSGSTIQFDVAIYGTTGLGLTYANQAAFAAAGWTLAFIDMTTGVAVSPTISYTFTPVSGVDGRHTVVATLTTATWFVRITPPSALMTWNILPTVGWTGEANDFDTIYARLNSAFGVTSSTTVPGVALPNLVEGDSYSTTVAVPTSYLSRMGWTDLSGTTLSGTIRRPSDDGTGTAAATLTEGTYLAHNATLTYFDISWTTFPAGMVLTSPERATGSVTFRVEVQAVKTGKTLTVLYNSPLIVYRQDAT